MTNRQYIEELNKQQSNPQNKEWKEKFNTEESKNINDNQWIEGEDNKINAEDPYWDSIDEENLQIYHDQMAKYQIPAWEEDFDIEHVYEPKNLEEYVVDPDQEMIELRGLPLYTQELNFNIKGKNIVANLI